MNLEIFTFKDIWLFIFFISIFISAAVRSKKIRSENKKRVNDEFENEIKLTTSEFENRLGSVEQDYEDLERKYWAHISLAFGIGTYLYWDNWIISILIGIVIAYIGWKYIAIRPFSNGIPD